jgi:hypothetical protein
MIAYNILQLWLVWYDWCVMLGVRAGGFKKSNRIVIVGLNRPSNILSCVHNYWIIYILCILCIIYIYIYIYYIYIILYYIYILNTYIYIYYICIYIHNGSCLQTAGQGHTWVTIPLAHLAPTKAQVGLSRHTHTTPTRPEKHLASRLVVASDFWRSSPTSIYPMYNQLNPTSLNTSGPSFCAIFVPMKIR